MTSILDSLFKMPQGTGWLQVRPPDSVLLPDGTIVFASTSSELPDKYFGAGSCQSVSGVSL